MQSAHGDGPLLAAIGILSHGGNGELRSWIRKSWLSPSSARDARAAGVVVRFVLRELGASSGERREADLHHDVAFVAAQAALKRGRGPLVSLFLWWRHALSAWPGVLFIGKADDDIYCHVTGVAAHLRQSLLTVREATRSQTPRIYWGAFEQFSFDEGRHTPLNFQQDRPSRCKARRMNGSSTVFGPFPFAKGPLYFVSSSLVEELLASPWLQTDLNATVLSIAEEGRGEREAAHDDVEGALAGARQRGDRDELAGAPTTGARPLGKEGTGDGGLGTDRERTRRGTTRWRKAKRKSSSPRVRVWEDVYTGYILSRLISPTAEIRSHAPRHQAVLGASIDGKARGPSSLVGGRHDERDGVGRFVSRRSDLAVVEYGFGNGRAHPHYSDGYGQQLARSTLVWHMRTKRHTSYRVAFAHHWLVGGGRHCLPPASRRWVRCGRNTERASSTSCIGSRWLRCTSLLSAYADLQNCTKLVELKHASKAWLTALSGRAPD